MQSLINVPLPTWNNLISSFLKKKESDIALSARWRSNGNKGVWFSRSAWSLLAIAKYRVSMKGQKLVTIWVPEFFCNSTLAPLRNIDIKLVFYPVTNRMQPDFNACNVLAEKKRPDLFVLVHYFGNPSSIEMASDFCKDKQSWLVEDAAHVLKPTIRIGEYGDFVLYSPYKHLPLPDGALLIINENGPSKLSGRNTSIETFHQIYHNLINSSGFTYATSVLWLIKRMIQLLGIRNFTQKIYPYFQEVEIKDDLLEHPKMSSIAKRLLTSLLGELDVVATTRRQNSMLWRDVLSNMDCIKYFQLPIITNVTPYLLRLSFQDEKKAEELFFHFQQKGFPVTTWPDLPLEILKKKKSESNAVLFRNTCIYFQVHQTLKLNRINEFTHYVKNNKNE
jgi:hypothetical protein